MIFLNQKMNLTKEQLKEIKDNVKNEDIVIFPTMPLLSYASDYFKNIGSQDVSEFESGAYTGQTSIKTLKSLNVKYCLIGHSEKRTYLNETEEKIIKKIELCNKFDITPIFIIGESEADHLKGQTLPELEKQITSVFNNLHCSLDNIIVAYEPFWSIGNNVAETTFIDNIIVSIKKIIKDYYNVDLKVIYGGGIHSDNIRKLQKVESIDGYLVGTSSTDYNEINKIISETN